MAPSPYHRDVSSNYPGAASASVTPAPVESAATATATATATSSSSPSTLSLSIPSAITTSMKSQQAEIISPTTYALAQKPILLDTPDRDTVCRPVATLQAPPSASAAMQQTSNGVGNKNHPAGFDIDLGIQNMTLLRPTASSAEMLCTPVRNSKANSNPGEDQGQQHTCAGTCSLVKEPLVLLDTPDKDTICRPMS